MMSYNYNIQFYASFLGKKFSKVSVIIQISMTCFYLMSKHKKFGYRGACWIQWLLLMHFQLSEWNNGKWSFFCSLKLSPSVGSLHLPHTWLIGGCWCRRYPLLYSVLSSYIFNKSCEILSSTMPSLAHVS